MLKIRNSKALYVEKDKVWIAKGLKFWAIDFNGNKITKVYKVGSNVYSIRLLRQLLRKGIHHLIPLHNGNILVTLKKKTLILDKDGNVVNIFSGYNGNKPGHRGICLTPNGYIFFGEYALNSDRTIEIKLYRSIDDGQSFQVIHSFKPGEIRHIHFIEWDKYDECLWIGTGDYGIDNSECRLYRSKDYCETLELMGSNEQSWRSIGICPTKNYVYWGTDAGHCKDKNNIVRYDKVGNTLKKIYELTGPCHGMCITKNGTVYISTGVEGGENETDKYAKLYVVDDLSVIELRRIKKDIFPFVIQFGVLRFPIGCENSNKLIYTAMAQKGNGETIYIEDSEKYE